MEWTQTQNVCKRCGKRWWRRNPDKPPKVCPACKSKHWDADEAPVPGRRKSYAKGEG